MSDLKGPIRKPVREEFDKTISCDRSFPQLAVEGVVHPWIPLKRRNVAFREVRLGIVVEEGSKDALSQLPALLGRFEVYMDSLERLSADVKRRYLALMVSCAYIGLPCAVQCAVAREDNSGHVMKEKKSKK